MTFGALTKALLPNGKIIEYPQDAQNIRVAKKVNGQITQKYLWQDLTTLLAVYDGNDNLVWRFAYADGRMPVAMTDSQGNKYYLHYDQVGSLRAVSDTSGNIIKEIVYDTFGNVLLDTNPNFRVPFGFAGGLYDPDTKLTHFGYREYDAYTGKWTAKDPIGFAGGDSNLYGYVLGDPVNLVDPEGLAQYCITKPEIHPGSKEHVHWGEKGNPRQNAVNKDGSIRHGKTPPKKVKKMINKKYKWNFKTPIIDLTPFDNYQQFNDYMLCGEYGCSA